MRLMIDGDISHLVVMGVCGTGKSTLARALSMRLGWEFLEADDFHCEQHRQKMSRGEGLTDEERAPWLARIGQRLAEIGREGGHAVLACSALRDRYRDQLRTAGGALGFVHLVASKERIERALRERPSHYAGAALLESQLRTLEACPEALTLEAYSDLNQLTETVLKRL